MSRISLSQIYVDEVIITKDNDRRQKVIDFAFPHDCIGLIDVQMKDSSSNATGTGFLVSPDIVLTSAHLFYFRVPKTNYIQQSKPIKFYPSPNSYPQNGYQVQSYKFGNRFKETLDQMLNIKQPLQKLYFLRDQNVRYDFAVLKLKNAIHKQKYIKLIKNYGNLQGQIFIFGYPFDKIDNLPNKMKDYKQYGHGGTAIQTLSSGILYHKIDTIGGQSGSPVLAKSNSSKFAAIAIHKSSAPKDCNAATLFTDQIFQLIQKWILEMKGVNYQIFQQNQWQFIVNSVNFDQKKIKIKQNLIKNIGFKNRCLLSQDPFPQNGKHKATLKIHQYGGLLGNNTSQICFGIMTQSLKDDDWDGEKGSSESAAFWTDSYGYGCVYIQNKYVVKSTANLFLSIGQVLTMQVDTNLMKISWQTQKLKRIQFDLGEAFKGQKLYGFVKTNKSGDILQLI